MRPWRELSESFRAAVRANVLLGAACVAFALWLMGGQWHGRLPNAFTAVALGDGVLCLGLAFFMLAAKKTGSTLLFVLYFLWAYGASIVVMLAQAVTFVANGFWLSLLLIPILPFAQVARSYQAYRDDPGY